MTPGVAKSMTCLNVPASSAPTVSGMSSGCWIMPSGWSNPMCSVGNAALLQQHALNQTGLNNRDLIYFQCLHKAFHQ